MIGIWAAKAELEKDLASSEKEKVWLQGEVSVLTERLQEAQRDTARTQGALEESQRRVERLTELVAELRREGFNAPAAAGPVELGPELDPAVFEALLGVAKPGSVEWQREADYAVSLTQQGQSAKEVAAQIRRGGKYDPWK